MNNFYIAFAVYLNLLFVAAKLWDRIGWSWLWVMTPMIVMTAIGAEANFFRGYRKGKRNKEEARAVEKHLRELLSSVRVQKQSAREAEKSLM